MRQHTGLWLAAACLFAAASASGGEVSDFDRFELWNECRPMSLVVEKLPDDAAAIGLTEEAIEVAVRSRLRAARLYSEDYPETAWSHLYVNVNVVDSAFGIAVEYRKEMKDLATMLESTASTWLIGSTGTHGRDPGYILSSVTRRADRFIDEYLRVNEGACK